MLHSRPVQEAAVSGAPDRDELCRSCVCSAIRLRLRRHLLHPMWEREMGSLRHSNRPESLSYRPCTPLVSDLAC